MMDKKRLDALIEEATVDCYGEDEQFDGMYATLEDQLGFPLSANALGEPVEVIGLDGKRSDLRRGIVARVRKGTHEYTISLADLAFVDPDPVSAEWLEAYRYWLG